MVHLKYSFSDSVVDVESTSAPTDLGMEFREEIGNIMEVFSDLGLTDEAMDEQLHLLIQLRAQRRAERRREVARAMR